MNIPFDHVIDIGANEGQFFEKFSNDFGNPVTADLFEPIPEMIERLRRKWKTGSITIHPFALGSQNTSAKLNMHVNHLPSSSLLQAQVDAAIFETIDISDQKQIEIEVRRIDDVVDIESLEQKSCILMKLDVQGFELEVLKGAHSTLGLVHAVLTEINFDTLYENQASFSEIVNYLKGFDFQYAGSISQALGSNGRCIYVDAVFYKQAFFQR